MVLVASLYELSRPSSPSGLLHVCRHLASTCLGYVTRIHAARTYVTSYSSSATVDNIIGLDIYVFARIKTVVGIFLSIKSPHHVYEHAH